MEVAMTEKDEVVDVETPFVGVQAKVLFDRVCDYLTERDWSFTSYSDKGYCSFGVRLRDGTVRVVVDAAEGGGWSRVTGHGVCHVPHVCS
jgi:hypothetical protein